MVVCHGQWQQQACFLTEHISSIPPGSVTMYNITLIKSKVFNQVPSLSLYRWRTLTLLKIYKGCVVLCFKLEDNSQLRTDSQYSLSS